jgi:hypothetical protein
MVSNITALALRVGEEEAHMRMQHIALAGCTCQGHIVSAENVLYGTSRQDKPRRCAVHASVHAHTPPNVGLPN